MRPGAPGSTAAPARDQADGADRRDLPATGAGLAEDLLLDPGLWWMTEADTGSRPAITLPRTESDATKSLSARSAVPVRGTVSTTAPRSYLIYVRAVSMPSPAPPDRGSAASLPASMAANGFETLQEQGLTEADGGSRGSFGGLTLDRDSAPKL